MELARSTSRGGFSVRRIFTFVLAVLMAALLAALFTSPLARAADPTAEWAGESILYDGGQYYTGGEAKQGDTHNLPVGSHYYVHVETVDNRPLTLKAHVIYFAPGTDPPTATSATYVTYDLSSDKKVFSNPQGQKSITITPSGDKPLSDSSCNVDGVGWIICPVSVWLAQGMDSLFTLIKEFLEVQPLTVGDSNSDLYVAWNIMRSIANVAFIIAFIIIIYSQLTSVGLTNYGLKKLIPRLIVAAILVNLSFYVCALAVDISNILGYSLQDLLMNIREQTFNLDNSNFTEESMNWSTITGVVLGGVGAGLGWMWLAGSGPGLAYLIVPLLVGLGLTALFVLLVLAARQAIIIILVVISPLAFVAYLLPNTEKWFDKWKDLFMTMLIFFPAFSLVFGGSQLAGGIIIQNAAGAGSLVMMIFGMAVQIAPLVITPLLLKLSGGLLGQIAGIVNNPRKGLLDRTRNWANDRAEMRRQEWLAREGSRANLLRRTGQAMDNSNRRVKERTELAKLRGDNRYNRTRGHAQLHEQEADVKMQHETIENRLKGHAQQLMNTPGTRLNSSAVELEGSKTFVEEHTAATERMLSQYRAGQYDTTVIGDDRTRQRMDELRRQMAQNTIRTAAFKQGAQDAQYEIQRNIAHAMTGRGPLPAGVTVDTQELLDIAQSIAGSAGRSRAQAQAIAQLEKLEREALENGMTMFKARAVENNSTPKDYAVKVVLENRLQGYMDEPDEVIRAALEIAGDEAQIPILRKVRMSNFFNQEDVSKMLDRKSGIMKAKGAFDLQADMTLAGVTQQRMNASIAAMLGSTAAENFPEMKTGAIDEYAGAISDIIRDSYAETDPRYRAGALDGLKKTYFNLTRALTNPEIVDKLGDNLIPAINLHRELHGHFNDPSKVVNYDAIDPTR